jgi:hypothetical protein
MIIVRSTYRSKRTTRKKLPVTLAVPEVVTVTISHSTEDR